MPLSIALKSESRPVDCWTASATHSRRAACFCITILFAATILTGCNKSPYTNVSGTVTYQGSPVPSGEIRLTPDSNEGNRGPAVVAMIRDGKYSTPKEKGVVGGKYQLRIMGNRAAKKSKDPTASDFGDELFETQHQTADFPEGEEECIHNITIE